MSSPLTIVNVGYKSTNYWVISAGTSRLLVDLGWPGSLGAMKANLRARDIPMRELRYALATHYHMDHAGLGEELKREGVPLLVVDVQVDAIPAMKQWMKPADGYVEISTSGNRVITCAESRPTLAAIGIGGQVVHTPGHSDHCVSLLLDSGEAFTGDLTAEMFSGGDDMVRASWDKLRQLGATTIYPGHGPTRPL